MPPSSRARSTFPASAAWPTCGARQPGDAVIVDGDSGEVLVRPAEDIVAAIYAAIDARAERRRQFAALRDLPSVTRDGAHHACS